MPVWPSAVWCKSPRNILARRLKPHYPRVQWLKEQSYVNAQSIQPVKWVEFVRRIGKFEPPVMLEINRALAAWLNLKKLPACFPSK